VCVLVCEGVGEGVFCGDLFSAGHNKISHWLAHPSRAMRLAPVLCCCPLATLHAPVHALCPPRVYALHKYESWELRELISACTYSPCRRGPRVCVNKPHVRPWADARRMVRAVCMRLWNLCLGSRCACGLGKSDVCIPVGRIRHSCKLSQAEAALAWIANRHLAWGDVCLPLPPSVPCLP